MLLAVLLVWVALRLFGVDTAPDEGTGPVPSVSSTTSPAIESSATSSLPVVRRPDALPSNARVTRVVDGDTVDALQDGETKIVRIRLLGINTPESVDPRRPVECFGKEASRALRERVEGERVRLIEDPKADDRDRYGRLLRELALEDGTDVNATLVAQGYAHAYLDFPLDKDRKAQLRRLEGEARAAERGLWDPRACGGEAVR